MRKTTHIPLISRGETVPDSEGWELGFDDQRWGLVLDGQMTHMCYNANLYPPSEVSTDSNLGDMFYFDVGNELCVNRFELVAAIDRLIKTG